MKRISIIIILLSLFVITGCEKSNKVIVNGQKINTSKMEHKHCTREAVATDGEPVLEYDLYYTNDKLNILVSKEKMISSNEKVLDTYEEAYTKIKDYYKEIENYDTKIERDNNSVTYTATVDYSKIDISKLIKLEGEEDNIFENKVPKVEKWLSLAKKFGTKCKLVEE